MPPGMKGRRNEDTVVLLSPSSALANKLAQQSIALSNVQMQWTRPPAGGWRWQSVRPLRGCPRPCPSRLRIHSPRKTALPHSGLLYAHALALGPWSLCPPCSLDKGARPSPSHSPRKRHFLRAAETLMDHSSTSLCVGDHPPPLSRPIWVSTESAACQEPFSPRRTVVVDTLASVDSSRVGGVCFC